MRHIRHRFALAALLALALAGPAAAQDDADHARLLDTFGLLPAEEHAEAESELRRALFVDDHRRPLIAVVFLRSPLSEPVMRVHFARRADGSRVTPLEARVPPETWEAVLDRSQHFDRELAPGGPPILCAHGWTYTVEAVHPPAGYREASIRREHENACESGLATAFARELAAEAIALLPACALIEPRRRGFASYRLTLCGMLEGDRLAAAQALNEAQQLRGYTSAREGGAPRSLFADATAAAAWAEIVAGRPGSLFLERAVGEAPDRVRITGYFNRAAEAPEGREERAPVEMVWTSIGGPSRFQVRSITVGPSAPAPRAR